MSQWVVNQLPIRTKALSSHTYKDEPKLKDKHKHTFNGVVCKYYNDLEYYWKMLPNGQRKLRCLSLEGLYLGKSEKSSSFGKND